MNAFESEDDLIVDLAAYPDHSIMVQLHRTNLLFGLNPMDAAIPTRSAFIVLNQYSFSILMMHCFLCMFAAYVMVFVYVLNSWLSGDWIRGQCSTLAV